MEKTRNLIRKTIYCFLQNDLYFTSTSLLLALPYSSSVLLAQAFLSSSPSSNNLLLFITTLKSLFSSRELSSLWLLNSNLFEITIISLLTLPFTLSTLLLSKASVIQASLLHHRRNNQSLSRYFSSIKSLYKSLLKTHFCNILLIITVQISTFSLAVVILKLIQFSGFTYYNPLVIFTSKSLMHYVLVNILVNGNLALVISGMENSEGHMAVYKAWLLAMGKNSMAIMLALPFNLGLTATEALFRYKVARVYHIHGRIEASMVFEGLVIAYLYSFVLVLDTTASCLFCHMFK